MEQRNVSKATEEMAIFNENAQKFYNFIREHKEEIDAIPNSKLGLTADNIKYMFQSSPAANKLVEAFLNYLSTPENKKKIKEFHHEKYRLYNERIKIPQKKATPISPSTLIFQFATAIDEKGVEKKFCFVAISGEVTYSPEFCLLLQQTIEKFNTLQNDCEYIFVKGYIKRFHKLIAALNKNIDFSEIGDSVHKSADIYKTCAEKYIIAIGIKCIGALKEKFKLTENITIALYPFQINGKYGLEEGSLDKTVQPRHPTGHYILVSGNDVYAKIYACRVCQDNKQVAYDLMKAALIYPQPIITSPILNTMGSKSILREIVEKNSAIYFKEGKKTIVPKRHQIADVLDSLPKTEKQVLDENEKTKKENVKQVDNKDKTTAKPITTEVKTPQEREAKKKKRKTKKGKANNDIHKIPMNDNEQKVNSPRPQNEKEKGTATQTQPIQSVNVETIQNVNVKANEKVEPQVVEPPTQIPVLNATRSSKQCLQKTLIGCTLTLATVGLFKMVTNEEVVKNFFPEFKF